MLLGVGSYGTDAQEDCEEVDEHEQLHHCEATPAKFMAMVVRPCTNHRSTFEVLHPPGGSSARPTLIMWTQVAEDSST